MWHSVNLFVVLGENESEEETYECKPRAAMIEILEATISRILPTLR